MKRVFLLGLVICALIGTGYSQVVYYPDSFIYNINDTIIAENDTITTDSTQVQLFCSFINPDSIYEDQLIFFSKSGKMLTPIKVLQDTGRSSSGTVYRIKLTPTQMGYTQKQRTDSLWFPVIKYLWPSATKL